MFSNTKPAIFGVKVLAGKLTSNVNLIDESENKIGRTKNIQADKQSVEEAGGGMEVAISIPGTNFEENSEIKSSCIRTWEKSNLEISKK